MLTAASLLLLASLLPRDPVPEGAVLTVTTEKKEYLLGERVVLLLKLTNEGSRPFTIDPAIWQRSAARDEHVTVVMTDKEGRPAWDPFPESMASGGPQPPDVTLRKGESWTENVELWRHRIPDRAGPWTIRISRWFGWEATPERPNPSAEWVLTFREPTVEEAKGVLKALLAEGKRAHLHSACYSVYIPLLEEHAAAGNPAGAEGLTLNRDLAATRALLRMFASKDRAVADRAGGYLVQRIRVPVKEGDGEGSGFRRFGRATVHADEDIAPSWRPEFEAEARAAARAFLAGEGFPVAGAAADVLVLLGTPEDGPALATALDRFSLRFEGRDGFEDPDEWKLDRELERDESGLRMAVIRLLHRGLRPAAAPEGAGDALVWLQALSFADEEKDRPAEWWATLERLAAHPRALVRMRVASFGRAGDRTKPEVCRRVTALLRKDPDARVRKAAGEKK